MLQKKIQFKQSNFFTIFSVLDDGLEFLQSFMYLLVNFTILVW